MEINSLNINKKIIIQKMNDNDEWEEYYSVKADVKTIGSNITTTSSVVGSEQTTMFIIRYCKKSSAIEFNHECFRIKYKNAIFYLDSCDNDENKNMLIVMKGRGRLERQ